MSDSGFIFPKISLPDFEAAKLEMPQLPNLSASGVYEALKSNIAEFQKLVGDSYDVVAIYETPSEKLVVLEIGYTQPNFIRFIGLDGNKTPFLVLAHMNAASLVLRAYLKGKKETPRKIGFRGEG